MSNNLVNYSVTDKVAIMTLNAPPANCYTYEMMRALDDAILEARFNEEVEVILLTGTGSKFFCAGADINYLNRITPRYKYYFCLHANETLNRLEQTPKLVIAALNGHCVGGGLEIALAADMRVAKRGSGKIGLPEVTLGVLPGTGGTQRLTRTIGKARALELMTTGRLMEYEEALAVGLINHIFEPENWDEAIMNFARSFTTPDKAAKAVGLIKRAVQSGAEMSFYDGLALERELQQQLFQSEDGKEGIAAYTQKRKAEFKGQ
ncbi:MAG: enoyl-CoA hydratase/isomerase family protein [bacterium JZ-2024 1]